MTKSELVCCIADRTMLTRGQVRRVIDALFDPDPRQGLLVQEMYAERKVVLPGFGTFEARKCKARRIYVGDKPYDIPEHLAARFRPGEPLRRRLKIPKPSAAA